MVQMAQKPEATLTVTEVNYDRMISKVSVTPDEIPQLN